MTKCILAIVGFDTLDMNFDTKQYHHPSSIIGYPPSIIHHPSSIIIHHHPSPSSSIHQHPSASIIREAALGSCSSTPRSRPRACSSEFGILKYKTIVDFSIGLCCCCCRCCQILWRALTVLRYGSSRFDSSHFGSSHFASRCQAVRSGGPAATW